MTQPISLTALVNAATDDLTIASSWLDGKSDDERRLVTDAFQNGVEASADAIVTALTAAGAPIRLDLQVAHRFRSAADILEGMAEGIDGDRLGALVRWALHGTVGADEQNGLVRAFAAPWLAAEDEAEWQGDATAEALNDIARITAEADVIGVEQ